MPNPLAQPVELVAHRAGNCTQTIPAAADVADTIEADVHLFRGRIEVRHAKVVWPTSIQWDRWWIDPRPDEPPLLPDVTRLIPDDIGLWLDLKSFDTRLSRSILRQMPGLSTTTVSSRSWWVLRPWRAAGIRTMRSVGSRWQLWAVRRIRSWGPTDGIVIHERLLTPETLVDLRRLTPWLAAWGVEDVQRGGDLIAAGIRALILDDLDLIGSIRTRNDADLHSP